MTTYIAHALYDAAIAKPDRWRLADTGDAVVVRFRFASGPEHVVTLPMAHVRLRMIESDGFATAPIDIEDCAGRVEFILRCAPEPVVDAIRLALANAPTDPPPAA